MRFSKFLLLLLFFANGSAIAQITQTGAGTVAGGGATGERLVSNGNSAHIAQATITAPRTRVQSRTIQVVHRSGTGCKVGLTNYFMGATADTAGAQDVIVNKIAIQINAATTPITFSGSASHTVTAGTVVDWSDSFGSLTAGDSISIRIEADMVTGAATYTNRTLYSQDAEQSFQFDPLNEIDQIYNTGVLSTPTGAQTINPWAPLAIKCTVPISQSRAVVGMITSIELGLRDEASAGIIGGGYVSRAAYAKSRPYIAYSLNGASYSPRTIGGSHNILDAILPLVDIAFTGGPTNDIVGGSTSVQVLATMESIYTILRNASVATIIQGKIIPRGSSTSDKGVTPVGMTVVAGTFGAGSSVRNLVNTGLAATSSINGFADVSTPVEDPVDPTKFIARSYASVLAASMLSGAAIASVVLAPSQYEALVFDFANASGQLAPTTFFICRVVSGAGPFSCSTSSVTAVGVAQNIANTVNGTTSYDVVHPFDLPNVNMSTSLQPYFNFLLKRDFLSPVANDNDVTPMWLNQAA